MTSHDPTNVSLTATRGIIVTTPMYRWNQVPGRAAASIGRAATTTLSTFRKPTKGKTFSSTKSSSEVVKNWIRATFLGLVF